MAKTVSITRELIRATNISRRRKGESEQAYFNRIVLEVGGRQQPALMLVPLLNMRATTGCNWPRGI
jgi:hypothetical protein